MSKGSRRRPEAPGYDPAAVCDTHGHAMPDQHGRCVRCGAVILNQEDP